MLQEKQLYAVLTEMVQLDAYEDHGILATNEKPLMTCSDCEVNKNIYLFGTCKCGNIYSEKLPHPSEEGEPDEHGKVRYTCFMWKLETGYRGFTYIRRGRICRSITFRSLFDVHI